MSEMHGCVFFHIRRFLFQGGDTFLTAILLPLLLSSKIFRSGKRKVLCYENIWKLHWVCFRDVVIAISIFISVFLCSKFECCWVFSRLHKKKTEQINKFLLIPLWMYRWHGWWVGQGVFYNPLLLPYAKQRAILAECSLKITLNTYTNLSPLTYVYI